MNLQINLWVLLAIFWVQQLASNKEYEPGLLTTELASDSLKYPGESHLANLRQLTFDSIEQITYDPTFDAFPKFSPHGSKLLFSSNRNNGGTRDTNGFIADWVV